MRNEQKHYHVELEMKYFGGVLVKEGNRYEEGVLFPPFSAAHNLTYWITNGIAVIGTYYFNIA